MCGLVILNKYILTTQLVAYRLALRELGYNCDTQCLADYREQPLVIS